MILQGDKKMGELMLIKPFEEYSEQIMAYRQEFLDNNDSMDGTSSLRRFDQPKDWFEWLIKNESMETCAKGWTQSFQYLCIRKADNRLVGMIDIRPALNDYLFKFGGNIGYSIRLSERGKGYAKEQLRLALAELRKLGVDKVLITCYNTNIASQKVILSANGIFENEAYDESDQSMTQRYWVDNR
jgi:predicted acetyltransferase